MSDDPRTTGFRVQIPVRPLTPSFPKGSAFPSFRRLPFNPSRKTTDSTELIELTEFPELTETTPPFRLEPGGHYTGNDTYCYPARVTYLADSTGSRWSGGCSWPSYPQGRRPIIGVESADPGISASDSGRINRMSLYGTRPRADPERRGYPPLPFETRISTKFLSLPRRQPDARDAGLSHPGLNVTRSLIPPPTSFSSRFPTLRGRDFQLVFPSRFSISLTVWGSLSAAWNIAG